MFFASAKSGLYWTSFPSNFPATNCFPLGDQETHEINAPGGKVEVSNLEPSALTRNIARLPLVKTTASISGTTGFQAISYKKVYVFVF